MSRLVVSLTPPGRLPTVAHDPGQWWTALTADDRFQTVRFSANFEWWRVLCTQHIAKLIPMSRVRRVWCCAQLKRLRDSGTKAAATLQSLRGTDAYACPQRYIGIVTDLITHLDHLNEIQDELQLGIDAGGRVAGLNYDSSGALVAYSTRDTFLANSIAAALGSCPRQIALLLVSVTCPEDLLSALIAVRILRLWNPGMHACLADHGYENFSLAPHLDGLRRAGTIDRVFDSIIASKDERDTAVPALARAVACDAAPRGFLQAHDVVSFAAPNGQHVSVPPPVPVFAPEPIFWTRFSSRRCYWSRCSFCVQNSKYAETAATHLSAVPSLVDRLSAVAAAGYRRVILSDEALSPAVLNAFSRLAVARGLRLRWACRCKLERNFSARLFATMREAGCCDVLFGLESISPRMLRRMNKYVEGLDAQTIARIFADADAAGISIHVNLIAGFPGETPEEAVASVDFLVSALKPLSDSTFHLNEFALFHGTPVAQDPEAFGIQRKDVDGDLPWAYPYDFAPDYRTNGEAVLRLIPGLRARLSKGLGWDRYGTSRGAEAAIRLYFLSGHKYWCVFKRRSKRATMPESTALTEAEYPACA